MPLDFTCTPCSALKYVGVKISLRLKSVLVFHFHRPPSSKPDWITKYHECLEHLQYLNIPLAVTVDILIPIYTPKTRLQTTLKLPTAWSRLSENLQGQRSKAVHINRLHLCLTWNCNTQSRHFQSSLLRSSGYLNLLLQQNLLVEIWDMHSLLKCNQRRRRKATQWMTSKVLDNTRHRNKLYRRFQRDGSDSSWLAYKQTKN